MNFVIFMVVDCYEQSTSSVPSDSETFELIRRVKLIVLYRFFSAIKHNSFAKGIDNPNDFITIKQSYDEIQ